MVNIKTDDRETTIRARAATYRIACEAAVAIAEYPPDGHKMVDVRVKARSGSGQRVSLSLWFRHMREDAPRLIEGTVAAEELEVRLELMGVRT